MRRAERRAESIMRGLFASTGALPGSAMPSASHATCIEFAVAMPEHTPGPRIAFSLMPRNVSRDSLPKRALHGAEEHIFDVDVLAEVLAARVIAADDEDASGMLKRPGGHQVRRRRLVAGGEADHAVELRALDGDLHVVHDEIAARQQ